jgi:hypothetical protein
MPPSDKGRPRVEEVPRVLRVRTPGGLRIGRKEASTVRSAETYGRYRIASTSRHSSSSSFTGQKGEAVDEASNKPRSEISRRTALKRIGAGAAVAWTAPAIVTATAQRAWAASGPCSPCADALCFSSGDFCPPESNCCICSITTENDCFCGDGCPACDTYPPCSSSKDCTGGARCITLCCTNDLRCAPPCPPGRTSAPRSSGKRGGDRA